MLDLIDEYFKLGIMNTLTKRNHTQRIKQKWNNKDSMNSESQEKYGN